MANSGVIGTPLAASSAARKAGTSLYDPVKDAPVLNRAALALLWVKVFTTEFESEVRLEDLVGGNPVIDLAKSKTEIEWQLLQTDPDNPLAGQLESGYGAPVGKDAASIIRRYEFFSYAGRYDNENHEALVGSDSHPQDFEIGAYLGAQNGAVNLNVAAIPEPQTYAMLLAGIGVLGAAMRIKAQG